MSIVIDSSVVVAALIDNGPGGAWAEHTIEGKTHYAPELLRVEVTNILRRFEGAKQITTPEATAMRLMEIEIELFSRPGACAVP